RDVSCGCHVEDAFQQPPLGLGPVRAAAGRGTVDPAGVDPFDAEPAAGVRAEEPLGTDEDESFAAGVVVGVVAGPGAGVGEGGVGFAEAEGALSQREPPVDGAGDRVGAAQCGEPFGVAGELPQPGAGAGGGFLAEVGGGLGGDGGDFPVEGDDG